MPPNYIDRADESESRAICHYIAAKYADQGTKLLPDPTDLNASAIFNQWLSVELDDWNAFAYPIVAQKFFNK
jgi:glutathione S-transferase